MSQDADREPARHLSAYTLQPRSADFAQKTDLLVPSGAQIVTKIGHIFKQNPRTQFKH